METRRVIKLNMIEKESGDIGSLSLFDYKGDNFIERIKNMVDNINVIRKEYYLYKRELLPKLESIIKDLNSSNFIEKLVLFEDLISEFLSSYFHINSFFIGNNLMKKIKNDFDYSGDLKYFYLLLEKLENFIKNIDLDAIPYIPESNLYSISENGVLYLDLKEEKFNFYFEYYSGKKYIEEYKKSYFTYNSIESFKKKDLLNSKKDFIFLNKEQFDGKYFEVLKAGIFTILDLVKREKNIVFGEIFYRSKISDELSNEEFLIDLNDFLVEFNDLGEVNEKLKILFRILNIIVEDTYRKSFLDIEKELGLNLDSKDLQVLKTELFLLIERIKNIS